jgi:2-hydroxy-3-oxopropionate reductase
MKIAFIGTGLMGYPMAKNLINKKLNLKVFSRTLEKAKPLEKLGAIIVDSLGEAVKEADIVITMLTDDNAVEKVLGDQEFLNNLKISSTVIYMSSIKP